MRRSILPLVLLALGTAALPACTSNRSIFDDARYPDRRDTRYPDDRPRGTYEDGRIYRLPDGREVVRDRNGRVVVIDLEGRRTDYGERSQVCHNGRTQTVSDNAVAAHMRHGDRFGACGDRRWDRQQDDRRDRDDRRYERDDDDHGDRSQGRGRGKNGRRGND